MSNKQQPRQWFRFGSFFQAAQRPQPRPNPPTTTPTQQPAIRPPVLQTRQPAPQPTPSQEPPRPVGASKEVTVQRFPVKPTLVAAPAPSLPRAPVQTPTPPLAFQLAPPVETPPVPPPPRPLGASNEAKMNRSVTASMPSSVPPQRLSLPPTSNSMPRSPPKSTNQDHSIKKSPEYVKPTSHPPSSKIEQAEQKGVLAQETLDKSRIIPSNNSMETTKKKNGEKEKGKKILKKLHDSEKSGTRLILAGVNRGAVMDLNNTDKKDHSGFRGNGKKLLSVIDGLKEETSNPNMDSKTHKKGMYSQSSTMKAFINNNVQGFSNSIVLNSSCKEKDPGVHLCLSRKGNVGKD